MVKPGGICTGKTILLIKPACREFASGPVKLYKSSNIIMLLL